MCRNISYDGESEFFYKFFWKPFLHPPAPAVGVGSIGSASRSKNQGPVYLDLKFKKKNKIIRHIES